MAWYQKDTHDYTVLPDSGFASGPNSTTIVPGFTETRGPGSMRIHNGVAKFNLAPTTGFGVEGIVTYSASNLQMDHRIKFRWKVLDAANDSLKICLRHQDFGGNTFAGWTLNFSEGFWQAYGIQNASDNTTNVGEQALNYPSALSGFTLGFVSGNEYDIDASILGDIVSLTINNADGSPLNFNGGTNTASYSMTAKRARAGMVGINPGYASLEAYNGGLGWALSNMTYYDTVNNSVPNLVVTTPVVSNLTTSTMTLTTSVSGGTSPYSYQWQSKINTSTGLPDNNGTFTNISGAPNSPVLPLTGLTDGTQYDIRVNVTDSTNPVKTASAGKQQATNSIGLDVEVRFEFFDGGGVHLTALPRGGDAPYTYLWTPATSSAFSANSASLNTATFIGTVTDVEIPHVVSLSVTDAVGRVWANNNSYFPYFGFPVSPYLRRDAIVLRPTAGSAVALPNGFKYYQYGESITATGSPKSAIVMGNTLQALKGGTVSADGTNTYGTNGHDYLTEPTRSAFLAEINTNQYTDIGLRLGYNDNVAYTQTAADISTIKDMIFANCSSVQRIYLMPHIWRNGGFAQWGADNAPANARLRNLITAMSGVVASDNRLILGPYLVYDLSQADGSFYWHDTPSYTYNSDLTHPGQNGVDAMGSWDAGMILSQFPVASNAPVTGITAGAVKNLVFPVGTKGASALANQVASWSVARQGGGAAFGSIHPTKGIYTAPSSLPAGTGNADVVTATTAGGASTTVVMQLANGGTGGNSGGSGNNGNADPADDDADDTHLRQFPRAYHRTAERLWQRVYERELVA